MTNHPSLSPCFIFSCMEKKVQVSFHQPLVQLDYDWKGEVNHMHGPQSMTSAVLVKQLRFLWHQNQQLGKWKIRNTVLKSVGWIAMKFSLDIHAPLRINLYTMGFPCVIYYVIYSVFQDIYFFSFSGRWNHVLWTTGLLQAQFVFNMQCKIYQWLDVLNCVWKVCKKK